MRSSHSTLHVHRLSWHAPLPSIWWQHPNPPLQRLQVLALLACVCVRSSPVHTSSHACTQVLMPDPVFDYVMGDVFTTVVVELMAIPPQVGFVRMCVRVCLCVYACVRMLLCQQ